MSEAVVDDIVAVLPPLLQSLEALGFIARHLNPPDFGAVMEAAGTPDQALQCGAAAAGRLAGGIRRRAGIARGGERRGAGGVRGIARGTARQWRSDCGVSRAAPRPARAGGAVSAGREIAAGERVSSSIPPCATTPICGAPRRARPSENTGIIHDHNEPGSRGGFSLYVPEYYTPDRAWPLVMALHGGSGNGRGFLWSWLRDARSLGAILVAPDRNRQHLGADGRGYRHARTSPAFSTSVRARWNVDPGRLLLTGMSDGGTFCYVTGLERASPFTHLAPVAATFHPLMAEMADAERLRGPADLSRARPARLDVSGAGGAADARGAVGGRRRGDLPRDRRSQPLLSARDQRGDPELAEPATANVGACGCRRTAIQLNGHREPSVPTALSAVIGGLPCAFFWE